MPDESLKLLVSPKSITKIWLKSERLSTQFWGAGGIGRINGAFMLEAPFVQRLLPFLSFP